MRLYYLLYIVILSGCSGVNSHIDREINISHDVKILKHTEEAYGNAMINKWLFQNKAVCDSFLKRGVKPFSQQRILKCFDKAILEFSLGKVPKNLVSNLLLRSKLFRLTEGTLSKILEKIAYGQTRNTSFIENLIKSGASTINVDLYLMRYFPFSLPKNRVSNKDLKEYYRQHKKEVCDSVSTIIRNNKEHYMNGLLTIRRPNKDETKYTYTDLEKMAYGGSDSTADCPDVTKQLVGYNPKAINIQVNRPHFEGYTPLHSLFFDFSSMNRDVELAKMLMSRKNINMQTSKGNTPLHHLLLYSNSTRPEFMKKDISVLKVILDLGGNVDIKNNDAISTRGLIIKRPDLIGLLR